MSRNTIINLRGLLLNLCTESSGVRGMETIMREPQNQVRHNMYSSLEERRWKFSDVLVRALIDYQNFPQ